MNIKLGLKVVILDLGSMEGIQGAMNLDGENNLFRLEDGGNIGGSRIHFPSVPGKYLADLRSRANSQQYSSIYED